ncbi:3,4-dihydroxy-2-butanone-4-phosphate synthase [Patulibacter minatonensis]|uniref:3,4-dihydroxy-2-butanone-4-phosphate synthase n=1 Tax=Patulibacter minatonensis TaxID=298163 RepID=UPI0004AE7BB1|nr:3,4-dihydroxy-2-butanone-4-phosphate synthase [Patulibacter minatonensis]
MHAEATHPFPDAGPRSSAGAFGCAAVELAEDAADHRVRHAVAALRDGRAVLVTDPDRGTGGVVMATADAADHRVVTFMATHARGLVQLALTPERCERLGLRTMTRDGAAGPATGMTPSIEARHGVGTGISSADRARSIAVAIADDASARDLVSPGHMFPVRTARGGVRGAAGHAEAAVDLARTAGARPAGVLCVVLDDDGDVATGDALTAFALRHDLRTVTVGDVVRHRAASAPELEVRRDEVVDVGEAAGTRMLRVRSLDDGTDHVVFVRGDVGVRRGGPAGSHDVVPRGDGGAGRHRDGSATEGPVPTWIGARDLVAGVLVGGPGGPDAVRALRALSGAGRGVVVLASRPPAARPGGPVDEPALAETWAGRYGRHVAVGASVLRLLGVAHVAPLLPGDDVVAGLGRRGFVVAPPVADLG